MHGQVPLARRNLLAQPRRLAASAVGVGLAVMLILLLDGLWAGIREQSMLYTKTGGADLYVFQPGVRDLTAGTSVLPISTVDVVRSDPDVAWASPVRSAYVVLQLHGLKVASYVIGSVPGERGGPWSITAGRAATADDEVVLGSVLAERHGLKLGDSLAVMGHSLRVVGLSDTNGFMFSYVFVTHSGFDALSGTSGFTNAVLVGTAQPEAVAERLRAQELNVLPRSTVEANDVKFATDIFGSPVRLMVGIGFGAGTMIIALAAYTAIVERRREYGIVKAMGGTRARLVRLALVQTFTIAALGLFAGYGLFLAGRSLIDYYRPQFLVVLTAASLGRAAAAALAMALLGAVIPARRLAKLEPAVAYRSAS